jgi:hypothetical protein
MRRKKLNLAVATMLVVATPACATNTMQDTCSEIRFAYSDNGEATIKAVCLSANGMPHATSVVLQGIANHNGKLTQESGPSSFQKSCGNIEVTIDGQNVTLMARCRATNGSVVPTSLPLDKLNNNNGTLIQGLFPWQH